MKESAVRTRILDVASRLFYEQGYNLTGITQIIEEADIARASLYNHFESKADLLAAYLAEAEELWFEGLDTFSSRIKSPKKRLLALFDYRIGRQVRSDFAGCHFIKISAEVPKEEIKIFELVAHQKNRMKEYIKEQLQQINAEAKQTVDVNALTEIIYLLSEGAVVSASIYKDAGPLRNAKKIVEKML